MQEVGVRRTYMNGGIMVVRYVVGERSGDDDPSYGESLLKVDGVPLVGRLGTGAL